MTYRKTLPEEFLTGKTAFDIGAYTFLKNDS